jgi:hypothetical protein
MPVFNNILAGSSGQGDTSYTIDQSLRFEDSDSAYLSRTPSSVGNRKTWTYSFWFKRSGIDLADHGSVLNVHAGNNNNDFISLEFVKSGSSSEDAFRVSFWNDSIVTSQVFRDPSSWGHLIIACDTTQSTASDRVKFYYNGEQITSFSNANYPSQDANTAVNAASAHVIGEYTGGDDHYDGYLAEVHFIDGQALTPASFGETNSDTNQWVPIKYVGSYGTNGFYLKFQDSSALGDDSSGNTNDFTVNNLVATDQVLDSPSNSFATLNPLVPAAVSGSIFSEGNLKYRTYKTGGDNVQGEGTIGFTSGKWYWEIYLVGFEGSTTRRGGIGVGDAISNETWTTACTEAAILTVGNLNPQAHNVVNASTGTSWSIGAAGDIWCCAFDADAGTFIITKNTAVTGSETDGKWTGFATSTVGYRPITVEQSAQDYTEFVYNFGQDSSFAGNKTSGAAGSDFYFTPPTGYKALNSSNLDDPAIALPEQYFNTVLYTGDGTTNHAITGVGFQPDLVWYKVRSTTGHNNLYDSVRGVQKVVYSDLTNAEATSTGTQDLYAFGADGFTVGSNFQTICNTSGETFASWNWKAASSNTSVSAGSIDGTNPTIACTRRTNTTAGFSIVSYTGQSAAGTVSHGLSQAPEMIILKNRDQGVFWAGYVEALGNTKSISLNDTGAAYTEKTWNDTSPTSTVFSIGAQSETSSGRFNVAGEKFIAYCFHSVDGYSKVGSYIGNGLADGTFVYTGFKPAFLLIKRITGVQDWMLADNKTSPYNQTEYMLRPAQDAAQQSGNTIDILSNGFKPRLSGNAFNASGESYLVLAFAESPFKYSNAR